MTISDNALLRMPGVSPSLETRTFSPCAKHIHLFPSSKASWWIQSNASWFPSLLSSHSLSRWFGKKSFYSDFWLQGWVWTPSQGVNEKQTFPQETWIRLRMDTVIWPTKVLLLLNHFSHVRLCATPQTAAHQAPPSLGVSRQEHWSGLPFPSPMHESEKWKWSCSVVSDS